MLNTGFSPWPCFTEEEADAVARVLRSNKVSYWTGNEGREFEREFGEWVGTDYAIAMANGSVALEAALKAVGISCGDDVIVTPRSFIASASCVVACGARPVFADVDENTQNLTAESIREALTPRTRAVICVHLAGLPCDMEPIVELAAEHGIKVIEDCAQAHGAMYRGSMAGSLGHVAAWSFCQDKIMTTGGEGGMITTNDREIWSKAWSYKDHGKSWEAVHGSRGLTAGFRWLHESFGTNGRMTEMQSAVGRIQLRRMNVWSKARRVNARRLEDVCRTFRSVRLPTLNVDHRHAFYRFYGFVRPEHLSGDWNRDRIVEEINARGVPCFHGACPELYLEKCFDDTGWRPPHRLPVARALGETSFMLLVHPTLTAEELDRSCDVLDAVLEAATA